MPITWRQIFMLLNLLLELLGLAPNITDDVESILTEVHSNDPTGTKVANIATQAGNLAIIATKVASTASRTNVGQ